MSNGSSGPKNGLRTGNSPQKNRQWPTIGRIVVFILLGVILLVLSFLYQRLKSALFRDDEKA